MPTSSHPIRFRNTAGAGTRRLLRLVAGSSAVLALRLLANPEGLTVQSGSAAAVANGNQLTVTASHNAFLNWQSFNIGAGQTTTFIQPSAQSIVWNQINDANPSQIFGTLNANGMVVLMNRSGFYFGPNSFVQAAGLVVSTAPLIPTESSAGLFWQFNGAPPSASIINYGQLNVGRGGSAFLIAEQIANHGSITAPAGNIGLVAGQDVLISERPDGRGLSAQVTLPGGSVDNFGRLTADGGTIALNAQVVNQHGLIQANSVQEKNGIIELLASDSITLGADSMLAANGDAAVSKGGQITIKAENTFADAEGSSISVAGGAAGGNGGFVEVSAADISTIHSRIDGHAAAGSTGGQLLIDPNNINLGSTGSGSAGSGTVLSGDAPAAGTLSLNVGTAFTGFSQIDLQAKNNLTIAAGTLWDLVDSTGIRAAGSRLKLEAGNNITIGDGASIVAGAGWSVMLEAGRNFALADTVKAGTGNILFSGTGSLETTAPGGNITLLAGNNITVKAGFVRTDGGGSITAQAVAGTINTGSRENAFRFDETGMHVDPNLGGISTAKGGDVTLLAGLDIISYLPTLTESQADGGYGGGSGAFGSEAGNVTIAAGRNVSGHFVAVNGTGNIYAGVKKDAGGNLLKAAGGKYVLDATSSGSAGTSPKNALALSLVTGGWNVDAAQDIVLQEVRNPNGVFNDVGSSASTTKHQFTYAADAYVNLTSGNSVQLSGESLPRYNDFEKGITPIYPGTLRILTGAGGVILGNNVTLAPSATGNLTITTTGGGSLQTKAYADYLVALADYHLHEHDTPAPTLPLAPADQWQLLVSDSDKTQYKASGDFGLADHAADPLHLHDTEPIRLNLTGGMNGIILGVPKRAEINVLGDMVNSRLDGQNLHDTDVTSINVGQAAKINLENSGVLDPATDGSLYVGGNIINRNEFTSVVLDTAPDFAVFDLIYPPLNNSLAGLANQFYLQAVTDPSTHQTTYQLTFQGRMTGEQLDALLHMQVRAFDANGLAILDATGQPVTVAGQFASAAAINDLYVASQSVPLNPDTGYRLGGGGSFNINANNLDLGSTIGIVSQGPRGNAALAKYFTHGADVNVNLMGNLDMFSTKIASLNGGDITVNVGGYANIGSRTFQSTDSSARGIFTSAKSDVTVVAGRDININGSRIAAYDGGNVTVRSLHGTVDVGSGAGGGTIVENIYVDPITREILSYQPTIFGNGILATTFPRPFDQTFPRSHYLVGNILVETPEGSINTSAGGIIQQPLNGVLSENATITLLAGYQALSGGNNNTEPYAPAFTSPNLVTTEYLAGTGYRVQLVDGDGKALLDTLGNPIYVARLVNEDENTVFSDHSFFNARTLSETLASQQRSLKLIDSAGQTVLDAHGNPVSVAQFNEANAGPQFVLGRNIDVSGSGVIGQNIIIKATGSITGRLISRYRISVDSPGQLAITAFAQNIEAHGGNFKDSKLVGLDGVDAAGADASQIISQNANGAGSTIAQGIVANATSTAAAATTDADQAVKKADDSEDEQTRKNGKGGISVAQKVSRVTVILPPKNLSEHQNSHNPL